MTPLHFTFEELNDNHPAPWQAKSNAKTAAPANTPVQKDENTPADIDPSQYPLISCIMPTAGRAVYVARSIEMFLKQDYPNKELVIVYNHEDDLPKMEMPESVRLIRAKTKIIGAKRNEACRQSYGAIITHWDDDDIYNKNRLSVQAMPILTGEANITGLKNFLFYHTGTRLAYHPTPVLFSRMFTGSFAARTMMFSRLVWEQLTHYPNLTVADDAGFLTKALKKGAIANPVDGYNSYISMKHADNTRLSDPGNFTQELGWIPANLPLWAQKWVPGYKPVRLPYVYSAYHVNATGHIMQDNNSVGRIPVGKRDGVSAAIESTRPDLASDQDWPLISCIMPTANRASYVANSIGYFLQQDYPNKELIIVYNKDSDLPNIQYPQQVKLLKVATQIIGAKRNEGSAVASGKIFAQWDDDDIYSPQRLSAQALPIIEGNADMTGLRNMVFYEIHTGLCYIPSLELFSQAFQCNLHSGTLVFHRRLWDSLATYPNLKAGEDFGYLCKVAKKGAKIVSIDGYGLFVYVRHTSNTWRFEENNFRKYASWQPANLPRWAQQWVPFYQQAAIEQISASSRKRPHVLQ